MPCFMKTSKYCSLKCQHKSLEKPESWIVKKCKFCRQIYSTRKCYIKPEIGRNSNFCSRICVMKFKKEKFFATKKRKRTESSKLKKLLWGIFSEYIRQRDGGVCISCGKKDFWRKMDAGHYIPKTAGLSTYFHEKNVNSQCTYCNRWMHGNLSRYALALRKKYGRNILEELEEIRLNPIKISVEDYKKLIEKYKVKLLEVIIK